MEKSRLRGGGRGEGVGWVCVCGGRREGVVCGDGEVCVWEEGRGVGVRPPDRQGH